MRSRRLVLIGGVLAITAAIIAVIGALSSKSASANPLGGLTALSASEDQTCAITDTGGVTCWGNNVTVPAAGPDFGQPAVALGASYGQQCAILEDGTVHCWSYRSTSNPSLPGPAVEVEGGTRHLCALLENGDVSCWGSNGSGQIGLPAEYCTSWTPCSHEPTVPAISNAVALAVGGSHNCAVLTSGGVECWGSNIAGQLGNGSGVDSYEPVSVIGISDAVDVAAAESFNCAVTTSGGVMCWGLGYGNVATAVPEFDSGVANVVARHNHACALMTTGAVKCWGTNSQGQLGDGKQCGQVCPHAVDVAGLDTGVTQLALGVSHSCALMETGTAKCWGADYTGQLGQGGSGRFRISTVPIDVVQSEAKPTPTPTPCGESGCPSPTPRPLPPMTGLDFSISVDTDGDGFGDCGTGPGETPYCEMELDADFHVLVTLHALPSGESAYQAFQAVIGSVGVSSEQKSDIIWPECGFPATHYDREFLAYACVVPVGGVTSSYIGVVGQSLFSCTHSGSVTLEHRSGEDGTLILGAGRWGPHHEPGEDEQVMITCGDPISGDVDCSVAVTSIDAQLTLQDVSGVLDSVPCPQLADVNLDRDRDAIDSLITLQYTAGLVPSLPIFPEGP